MKTLKFNIGTGVLNIINCILFTVSWPIIFGTTTSDPLADTNLTNGVGAFFYFIASIGIIINIIAMIKSKNNNISIAGPVLGIIGNVLFLLSAALALPAIIILIIGTIFIFLHHHANGSFLHERMS